MRGRGSDRRVDRDRAGVDVLTPLLTTPAQILVMAPMLIARVGSITLFVGLVLCERARRYRHPTERPTIG